MLVSADLMSIVSAGASSANARESGSGNASAATSWLLAADGGASSTSGNDMINQIFMSYASDGEANPAARFAEDLKALLSAHGVLLGPDQTLLPESVSLDVGQHNGEPGEPAWSVDELLQLSMSPASGGNNLPLGDQTLPSVLSNWLAALTTPAGGAAASAETTAIAAGTASALLPGVNGAAGELTNAKVTALSAEAIPSSLSGNGGVAAGLVSAETTALAAGTASALLPGGSGAPGELATAETSALSLAAGNTEPGALTVAAPNPGSDVLAVTPRALVLGGSVEKGADTGLLASNTIYREMGAGNASMESELAARAPVAAEAVRQAVETAQVNPGSQKVASEAANASAFRSIQFSLAEGGDAGDRSPASQPEPIRAGISPERNQAIASQLTASMTGFNTETPPPSSLSQAFNPTDGSAGVNRAEQRMFATENAQQAQSQAAQQTATRTADGLPRFAMDTAFGQQGWSDSLGRQLLVMSSQGISSAQIRLDPPELGSLTVKIQMSADQQTSVSFVSQHAMVREALEQQLNRLQDLFRDQGLNLQDVSVSDQSPQQRDGEGREQQQGRGSDTGSGEQERPNAEPVIVRSESLIDFYA